jgi:alkanesulfonate monooxygenase SsuD/methylene tetrahydromethanopterin reductase-like flavin-dependent oxidoreductase (luciferase family)
VLPVSSQIAVPILREQWAHYENASHAYGRNPSRADWRISRDIVVADTDREARELAVRGGLGRTWREIQLPTFRAMNMLSSFTGGAIPDSDVTDEWIIDNLMIVGSPDTVVAKIERLYEDVGGFGGLVSIVYDETLQPERCEHSIKLLGTEVAPRLGALG